MAEMIDMINLQDKNKIMDVLNRKEALITFRKTDGSERVMNATLRKDLVIPYVRKTERKVNRSDEIQSVFDMELQEWRSFRWDSLVRFQFEW